MIWTAATAPIFLALLATGATAATQAPTVQTVMAEHAAEVCSSGETPTRVNGVPPCEALSNLTGMVGFADGAQRAEVLIRWVDVVAVPCASPSPSPPTSTAQRRPGVGPAGPALTAQPPSPPSPVVRVAACDAAVVWLTRFEAAMTDDRSRVDVAPALFLIVGQIHQIRGEALATMDGGPSARACEAFGAAREAVRRIDMSSWYAQARSSFPLAIAEVEAAGATCR